jgi:hypothetical protein
MEEKIASGTPGYITLDAKALRPGWSLADPPN